MIVAELITRLSKYPADIRVKVEVVEQGFEMGGVSLHDVSCLAKTVKAGGDYVVIFLEDE